MGADEQMIKFAKAIKANQVKSAKAAAKPAIKDAEVSPRRMRRRMLRLMTPKS